MFTETLTQHDDVIGIACEGKLTEAELKSMHALLHERLGQASKPGLFLDLTGFEGYEGLAALGEDLKMDTAHRNDFGRIAIVGEGRWMEWGTSLASLLTRSEMRWFELSEKDEAVTWARSS